MRPVSANSPAVAGATSSVELTGPVNVDAHHVGALAGTGDRSSAPDAPGGASYDRSLAAQTA